MKRSIFGFLVVGVFLSAVATIAAADDAKDEAIKKDRKQIEGTWRVVVLEVNGKKSTEDDAKTLTVVNGADGTWSLRDLGMEKSKGTSTFDPTKKAQDHRLHADNGGDKGKKYLGIYELGEKTRKLCFAPPGKERPTEFSSTSGSEHILVTLSGKKRSKQRSETMGLVNAMHITASVFINDDEPGLHHDFGVWLEQLAPFNPDPNHLPPQPHRRGQRRRPPEAADHGPRGRRGDHQGQARLRAVGADLLRRVRRPPAQFLS